MSKTDKHKRDEEHVIENQQTYEMYYDRLENYALSMFEWTGLPETINERFLEYKLLYEGKVVFFNDPRLGFLALPVQITGAFNVYQEPTQYQAFSTNYSSLDGDKPTLTIDNSVIMWNNYNRKPIIPILEQYARRLTRVERTIDVNLAGQKTPVLILAEESQRLSLQKAYEKYDGFSPFIFGNKKGFDKEAFQVLGTEAPFVADKLMLYKHDLWNEAMTFFGVGNANQDKKERLVEAEVSANDEQIEGSRFIMLKARQEACEKINSMFGLNVSVDFKFNKLAEQEETDNDEDDTNE